MAYLSSLPGRALLAATGLFILGPGLAAVMGLEGLGIRAIAVFPMLGVAACIISVAFGMFDYPRQTAVWLLWLPFILWLTFPGFAIVAWEGRSIGIGVVIAAAICLVAAFRPASNAKPGEFRPSES